MTARLANIVSSIAQPHDTTYETWTEWIDLAGQQRLLLCCYILEYQQATLLARMPQPSIIQTTASGFELPLPCHYSVWEAHDPADWAISAQHYAHVPTHVFEVTPDMNISPFDHFQSSLLIATQFNHFNNPAIYLAPAPLPAIDHLLDGSALTRHQLLTAKLLQVTPVRALLAVSGESWILSEKVPSPAAFSSYKSTLKTWTNGLWATTPDLQSQAVKDALKLSIELLQHIMAPSVSTLRLELGADMGLYIAALVIWAVTVASNTRIKAPQVPTQPIRYQSHSPLSSSRTPILFPSTPTHFSAAASQSPNPAHPVAMGLMPSSHPSPAPPTSNSMLHSEITSTSAKFLANALFEINSLGKVSQWPNDVMQWQYGCSALLRWVKMYLRNGALEGRDSVVNSGPTSAGTGRGGDGLGELLDGVVSVLEKVIGRGWEGWGV